MDPYLAKSGLSDHCRESGINLIKLPLNHVYNVNVEDPIDLPLGYDVFSGLPSLRFSVEFEVANIVFEHRGHRSFD